MGIIQPSLLKTTPFWLDEISPPVGLTSTAWHDQTEVAIIGGGYTGLSAARILAEMGVQTTVLDEQQIGGASTRNAGMVLTGFNPAPSRLITRFGQTLARELWNISLDAVDLVGEIVADEQISCHFTRCGHGMLAAKPSHLEQMKQEAEQCRQKFGHTVRILAAAEMPAEVGTNSYYGGWIDEYSASLHPAQYLYGLAQAGQQKGVRLYDQAKVWQLRPEKRGYLLQTRRGALQAKEVIIATNGYTTPLMPALSRMVLPAGSYILVTEPLPPLLRQLLNPHSRVFFDTLHNGNYFRLTPDGRMLYGGRHHLRPDLPLVESAARLTQRMEQRFSALRQTPIAYSWTGKIGLTATDLPQIGRIKGVHYALGYGGHGVSLATYAGTELGLLIAGKKTNSPLLKLTSSPPPFWGQPWLRPLLALAYRWADATS